MTKAYKDTKEKKKLVVIQFPDAQPDEIVKLASILNKIEELRDFEFIVLSKKVEFVDKAELMSLLENLKKTGSKK